MNGLGRLLLGLLILLSFGCAIAPTHVSLKNAQLPELIPVRNFVANTDFNARYRLAPDGSKVEYATIEKTREVKDEFGVAYLFALDGDIGQHTLVYNTPAALVNKELTFRFENLELP